MNKEKLYEELNEVRVQLAVKQKKKRILELEIIELLKRIENIEKELGE